MQKVPRVSKNFFMECINLKKITQKHYTLNQLTAIYEIQYDFFNSR